MRDRRDANEAECVGLWHSLGYTCIRMQPGQGCDYILITPRDIMVVEFKNPEYKWKLTNTEQFLKDNMERLGQTYHIVEYYEDAEYLAGVI